MVNGSGRQAMGSQNGSLWNSDMLIQEEKLKIGKEEIMQQR